MSSEPTLAGDALLEQLQGRFEQLCHDVAAAVNQAPAGQVINASEEKVRDLLADFRQATYRAALQLRIDAAQAAFSPSDRKSTRLNSSHRCISYAVFCLKKK